MATPRKNPDSGSAVTCPTCRYEIPLLTTWRLAAEISVQCPNCGSRGTFLSAEAHAPKQNAEPIRKFRRPSFSTGRKTAMRQHSG